VTGAGVDRPWRCFVAVPITEQLRHELGAAVATLRAANPAADEAFRWSEPEGWHVTLAFLGPVAAAEVPLRAETLRKAVAGTAPFVVTGGGLGAFPSPRRARVVWYRIGDPERRLSAVARAVRRAFDLDDSGPFRAHLTLARSRAERGVILDPGLLGADLPTADIPVDAITLYRSHLGRGPARYEALAEVPLLTRLAEARVAAASPT